MKKFIQKIRKVLHAVLDAWICRGRFCTITVAELPDSLQQRRFYVIGNALPWSAAFLCPCGCDEVIHISLLPNDLPSWSVSFNRSSLPTLSPSVRRTKGCRSHFFLREGSIVWCRSGDGGYGRGMGGTPIEL